MQSQQCGNVMPTDRQTVFPVSLRGVGNVLQSAAVGVMIDEFIIRARRLHEDAIVVDAHCDTTRRLMADDWDFSRRHDYGQRPDRKRECECVQ